MGFTTSWGQQVDMVGRSCENPELDLKERGSQFQFVCSGCGWTSRTFDDDQTADHERKRHERSEQGGESAIELAELVRRFAVPPGSGDQALWVQMLLGAPSGLLDALQPHAELIRAAIAGESVTIVGEEPEDRGGMSLEALAAGWAKQAPADELDRVSRWNAERPAPAKIPLRPTFAPVLYEFLLDRQPMGFAYVSGQRLPFVPSAIAIDAGFVAVMEQMRRSSVAQPAERLLEQHVRLLLALTR